MNLVFASTNPHKAEEIREILGPMGIGVSSLADFGMSFPPPEETAETLEGNARLKARAYAIAVGKLCLADDSGLVVDALGGAPGVHSADFAGPSGTREERDRRNREKLIRELRQSGSQDRSARLVCTLCLSDASGRILFETSGKLEVRILDEPRGAHGFGYDTHLYLPDLGKTLAELSSKERNALSHRGQATRLLGEWLRSGGQSGGSI